LLGWNSYTGYGSSLNEEIFIQNLETFCLKLKPAGYEYFVIDAGWDGVLSGIKLDEYGRSIPDSALFPHGLKPLIELVHSKGLKFGLWIARGISRKAVRDNLPIFGTQFHAQDIANIQDSSDWFFFNYGVDMNQPGSQEFYNSVVTLVDSWGVDFVKYDDIVPHPDEIQAVANAIKNCNSKIKLSLSPGDAASMQNADVYNYADMVRITTDIWDNQKSIDASFSRWRTFQTFRSEKCYIDLDMIPFGTVFYPEKHKDNFTNDQKYAFVTQRALSSSPLFVGGQLPLIDSFSLAVITNMHMLECNQTCRIGNLIDSSDNIETWKSLSGKDPVTFWIGIFNRNNTPKSQLINNFQLGLSKPMSNYSIFNIWNDSLISPKDTFNITIAANGVVFLKLSEVKSM
jgi:hypothetical protein